MTDPVPSCPFPLGACVHFRGGGSGGGPLGFYSRSVLPFRGGGSGGGRMRLAGHGPLMMHGGGSGGGHMAAGPPYYVGMLGGGSGGGKAAVGDSGPLPMLGGGSGGGGLFTMGCDSAPSYVSHSGPVQGGGAYVTLPRPSAYATGDWLTAVVFLSAGSVTWSVPSGWGILGSALTGQGPWSATVFYTSSPGGPGPYTFGATSGGEFFAAMTCSRGVSNAVFGAVKSDRGSSAIADSLTVTWEAEVWMASLMLGTASSTPVAPLVLTATGPPVFCLARRDATPRGPTGTMVITGTVGRPWSSVTWWLQAPCI